MSLEEKIIRHLHELPESKKAESLSSAMRGMENEISLYSLEDLKKSFS